MKLISSNQKQIALSALEIAFNNNPGVLWVIKKDNKEKERIKELCKYCLTVAIEKKGAYITSNNKGVALLIQSWKKQSLFNFIKGYFRLGQYCIGWSRAIKIIKRENKIQKIRPSKKHLYFWMLAVEDQSFGLDTIKEIRNFAFKHSFESKLPIYAETTMKKTLNLYLRYGFEVYDTWETNDDGIIVYFIYRDWNHPNLF